MFDVLDNYDREKDETGYKKIDGTKREPENAYDGKSTVPFAKIIKKIINICFIKMQTSFC